MGNGTPFYFRSNVRQRLDQTFGEQHSCNSKAMSTGPHELRNLINFNFNRNWKFNFNFDLISLHVKKLQRM
jgi:hypothetical protein